MRHTLVLAALTWLVAVPAFAQSSRARPRIPEAVPGEIIVKLKAGSVNAGGTSGASASSALAATNATAQARALAEKSSARWLSSLKVDAAEGAHHRLKVAQGQTVESALAELRSDPRVEYAEPNYVYRATAVPNDPYFSELWGLHNTGQSVSDLAVSFSRPRTASGTSGSDIGLESAWNRVTDCSGTTIAIVDTGINYDHEDLVANLWNGNSGHGYDFVDGDADPMDLNGHGTHVAGTIGAVGNNGIGTTGICWKASLMAVRVLDANGSGSLGNVATGIRWAVDHGAKVINLSLGGSYSETLKSAITYARDQGTVLITAAGNDGLNNDEFGTYPCAYKDLANIVCVAALNPDYGIAGYSNYGALTVHIGAPGTNILSTWPGPAARITESFVPADWGLGAGAPADKTNSWYPMSYAGTTNLACSSDWGNGSNYANALDAQVRRNFHFAPDANGRLPGGLKLYFKAELDTEEEYDLLTVAYTPENAMPWGSSKKVELLSESGHGSLSTNESLDNCAGQSDCSIGFRLKSDASIVGGKGARIFDLELRTWTRSNTGYSVLSGTSMAAPHVTGVAAMLFSAQPSYDWRDVVAVLKESGTPVSALADKTTTGRSLNAESALGHIKTPTGITASGI